MHVICCDAFSSPSVVLCAFSALCVYSKFGHHPRPLATFVPNFISFAASIAELARVEKLRTQSITHSVTHPAYLMPASEKFENIQAIKSNKTNVTLVSLLFT